MMHALVCANLGAMLHSALLKHSQSGAARPLDPISYLD